MTDLEIVISIVLLVVGFVLLIKGADFFVEGASSLAARMNIPPIVIGLTIVAFGTSTPELIVSILASISGSSDIALGNVVGSNIVNILLILGIAGIIYPLHTQKNTVWKEIPFSLLAAVLLMIAANDFIIDGSENVLSRVEGLVMLLFFVIFLVYILGIAKSDKSSAGEIKQLTKAKTNIYLIIGLIAVVAGGKLVVDNAIIIARALSLSEKLIGLTIVAIGTSLPELVTSAVAARKKMSDIAIGNIVGSNIFNIFFILGTSLIINPIRFESALNFDLMVLLAASLALFITMFTGKSRVLDRWEAVVMLITYIAYVVFITIRN